LIKHFFLPFLSHLTFKSSKIRNFVHFLSQVFGFKDDKESNFERTTWFSETSETATPENQLEKQHGSECKYKRISDDSAALPKQREPSSTNLNGAFVVWSQN
jgi:hypothetical protein